MAASGASNAATFMPNPPSELPLLCHRIRDTVRTWQEEGITGHALYEKISDELPPEFLFDPVVASVNVMYSKLKEYFNRNLPDPLPGDIPRVVLRLATYIYKDPEMTRDAIERASQIVSSARSSGDLDADRASASKRANSMERRFSETWKKFSGDLQENLTSFLREYDYAAQENQLTHHEKVSLFHHLFRDNAKEFYLEHVEGKSSTFADAVLKMRSEYLNSTRQRDVLSYLEGLRVHDFVQHKQGVSNALKFVYERITTMAAQCPTGFQDAAHQKMHLEHAVIGYEWAKQTIATSHRATSPTSLHQLYLDLQSAIRTDREFQKARGATSPVLYPDSSITAAAPVPGINYESGRFARHPKTVDPQFYRQAVRRSAAPHNRNLPPLRRRLECFNCQKNHLLMSCPLPLDVERIARHKAQHFLRKKQQSGRTPTTGEQLQFCQEMLINLCRQVQESDAALLFDDDYSHADQVEPSSSFFETSASDIDPLFPDDTAPPVDPGGSSAPNHPFSASHFSSMMDQALIHQLTGHDEFQSTLPQSSVDPFSDEVSPREHLPDRVAEFSTAHDQLEAFPENKQE
jgi:hypothetical protein